MVDLVKKCRKSEFFGKNIWWNEYFALSLRQKSEFNLTKIYKLLKNGPKT